MCDDVAKWHHMADAMDIKWALYWAWFNMEDGRNGPSILEVPMDVQGHAV